ncbi:MAG TPA: helix-turn-helix domain-containing protein [Thermomicrobiaceae bacterium]|nr:helix-turn-helix domain-containing protein [Thermomicrobiaceae bacterium]
MDESGWMHRFLNSTRGRIVALLRRSSRTVDELAQELDLTDNAVRSHLATLERDGLVVQQGFRPGVRKPAYEYQLTDEAEQLFPKPYAAILLQLLGVMTDRLGIEAVEGLLRTVGHQLSEGEQATGSVEERLAAAVALLNRLGGLAEGEIADGHLRIQGYRCPLAAVALDHPEVCRMAEALVSDIVGVPMHECCERNGRARCAFAGELEAAPHA